MRRLTGQLRLLSHPQHCIAFDRGNIVGATSSYAADSCVRVALTNRLIISSQVAEITRRIEAAPKRDEVDVLASVAKLAPDRALVLRHRMVLQRAARTFSLDNVDFVIDDRITLPRHAACQIDVGAVIFLGVLSNLSETRIAQDLRRLGSRFKLKPRAGRELSRFELPDATQPLIETLRTTTSVAELEAIHREVDPRMTQALVYALLACEACTVETEPLPVEPRKPSPPEAEAAEPRIARGTAGAQQLARATPPDKPRAAVGTAELPSQSDPPTSRKLTRRKLLPPIPPTPPPPPKPVPKPRTIVIPERAKRPTKR